VARSFRFVRAFADSIVFNYLAVPVCQANGYTLHPHPPIYQDCWYTTQFKLEKHSKVLNSEVCLRNGGPRYFV
jgi:hypothetical protein